MWVCIGLCGVVIFWFGWFNWWGDVRVFCCSVWNFWKRILKFICVIMFGDWFINVWFVFLCGEFKGLNIEFVVDCVNFDESVKCIIKSVKGWWLEFIGVCYG